MFRTSGRRVWKRWSIVGLHHIQCIQSIADVLYPSTLLNAQASFIYPDLLTINKGEFMHSASEAVQSPIISPYIRGVETETFLILSKISEEKDFLKKILEKYNAKNPEAIEKMIEQGKIDEHPAYEDYLSALSYEQNIKDLKKLLDNLVKRI